MTEEQDKKQYKIVLISDESYIGGASLVNHDLVEEGNKKGYSVDIYTYNMGAVKKEQPFNPPKADFYILANYGYIPKRELINFFNNNENKFVRFFHDIPGFIAQIPSSFHKESESILELMMKKAAHTFMISPMQYDVVKSRIDFDEKNITILPPFIPIGMFSKGEVERERDSWLYLGDISYARGIVKSIQIAINSGGKKFYLAGPEVEKGLVEQLKMAFGEKIEIEYLGIIDYKDVPALMHKYENFIYTPEIYDSFCRKILEANVSGMKLFVDNRRIGLFSYPEDYNLVDACKNSNKMVWKIITDIIDNGYVKYSSIKEDS